MEPPEVCDMFDTPRMNEHYSKEHAWELSVRAKLKRENARKAAVVGGPFDVEEYMKGYGYDQMYGRKKQLQATKQANYDSMWPLVHTICESLQYEPHKWEFQENRFKNLENGVEFWCHRMNTPVTETFMMGEKTTDKVFSVSQGEAILEAVKIALIASPSQLQSTLLDKFGLANQPEVVDERNVVYVPQMTFWQRLLFLLTARCKIS